MLIYRSKKRRLIAIRNSHSSFHVFSSVLFQLDCIKVLNDNCRRWHGSPIRFGSQFDKFGQIDLKPALLPLKILASAHTVRSDGRILEVEVMDVY